MEKRETAQALRDGAAAEGETVGADTASATARSDVALGEINELAAKAQTAQGERRRPASPTTCSRSTIASAPSRAGSARRRSVAASASGCRVQLSTVDLNAIRAAAPDEVVRCEECRRILVRVEDSGL